MKTLKEHNQQRQMMVTPREMEIPKYPRPNGIACPKCGKEMHDYDANILTSIPPKKNVICLECAIKGQSDPEIYARGQRKRTSDGMVTPREIARFINANN